MAIEVDKMRSAYRIPQTFARLHFRILNLKSERIGSSEFVLMFRDLHQFTAHDHQRGDIVTASSTINLQGHVSFAAGVGFGVHRKWLFDIVFKSPESRWADDPLLV